MSYLEKAEELANTLVATESYQIFIKLHKDVYLKNIDNQKQIDNYRELIVAYEESAEEDGALLQKIQRLEESLVENQDVVSYLKAEAEVSSMIKDVLEIIDEKLQGTDANR